METTFGLTPLQKKKFNALKKAYSECIKANMFPVNIYSRLTFYNGSMVGDYGDDNNISRAKELGLHPFKLLGNCRTNNSFKIAGEWCDDPHIIYLTDKGMESLNEENT